MRKLAAVAAVLILLGAAPAGATSYFLEQADRLKEGAMVPDYSLKALDGASCLRADEKPGRVTLLAFWSVYCAACVRHFEALVAFAGRHPASEVRVLSINTDGEYGLTEENVRNYVQGLEKRIGSPVPFPVVYDRANFVAKNLGISFLPALVAHDAGGRIVGVYRRFTEGSNAEILEGIEELSHPPKR